MLLPNFFLLDYVNGRWQSAAAEGGSEWWLVVAGDRQWWMGADGGGRWQPVVVADD